VVAVLLAVVGIGICNYTRSSVRIISECSTVQNIKLICRDLIHVLSRRFPDGTEEIHDKQQSEQPVS
jgi:hypothetical protein